MSKLHKVGKGNNLSCAKSRKVYCDLVSLLCFPLMNHLIVLLYLHIRHDIIMYLVKTYLLTKGKYLTMKFVIFMVFQR